ncbi:Choline transport protein [Fusarium oxysporum f. sp. albedinis]|nr:Choline transport protein [Fusarium oxysporum f. sp. albedinis]
MTRYRIHLHTKGLHLGQAQCTMGPFQPCPPKSMYTQTDCRTFVKQGPTRRSGSKATMALPCDGFAGLC